MQSRSQLRPPPDAHLASMLVANLLADLDAEDTLVDIEPARIADNFSIASIHERAAVNEATRTAKFTRQEPSSPDADDTFRFIRYSAPHERIGIEKAAKHYSEPYERIELIEDSSAPSWLARPLPSELVEDSSAPSWLARPLRTNEHAEDTSAPDWLARPLPSPPNARARTKELVARDWLARALPTLVEHSSAPDSLAPPLPPTPVIEHSSAPGSFAPLPSPAPASLARPKERVARDWLARALPTNDHVEHSSASDSLAPPLPPTPLVEPSLAPPLPPTPLVSTLAQPRTSGTIVAKSILETRIAELLMSDFSPCDLGDGIEVVHDVESVEIEMDCDIDDSAQVALEDDIERTVKLWFDELVADDLGTHQFVRHSAPYERIEIQLDANAFVRATIEDARTQSR